MKLNNKGFVVSTLMYALLIVFLFLIIGIITLLANRKMILDKLKKDVKEDINGMTKYTYYPDGTAIYYNPVTDKLCSDYEEENSLNETKTGCMKWYTFNDNINSNKVNMILDHNTTYKVAYNSAGTNSEPKEVQDELDKLVSESKWKVTPRMITADEIAKITGNDNFDSSLSTEMFYFDGTQQSGKGTSKYSWLFDYTYQCESYGCNINSDSTNGYWTSSPIGNSNNLIWGVSRLGRINNDLSVNIATSQYYFGIRPVITIDKKELKKLITVTFDYTGDSQTFVRPVPGNYKIELWGAQGTGNGGKGGYTLGTINLEDNIYIYVGGQSNGSFDDKIIGGYNGGGYGTDYGGKTESDHSYAGGGSTDVRLIGGNWNSFDSMKSKIMVAGGGAGEQYRTNLLTGTIPGFGGGLTGGNASGQTYSNFPQPTGSTQTGSGIGRLELYNGKFGMALQESPYNCWGSGAGGGYFGGVYGCGAAGSGGSSFISGHAGCVAITKDSTEDNVKQINASDGKTCNDGTTDITCSYHYSGLKFTDTVMIDGAGCKWTTEKTTDCSGMPTHDGKSTMTGNSGNGYAKITYLGK